MLGVVGCSEPPRGQVAVQVASRPAPDASPPSLVSRLPAADSTVVALDGDTIVIRRAELVMRQLWLQPAESGECEPEEKEYCAELQNDPVVVAFPLADSAERRFTSPAAPGHYSALQLDVYNPVPERDRALLGPRPEFAGISVRMQGVFSDSGKRRDFVATSDLTGIQELALTTPIAVAAGDTTALTLRLDLARVFLTPDAAALVDPVTAGPGRPHAHLVQDNIRKSLHAFRDENRDGLDDDYSQQAMVSGRSGP
jgi:hypothetical protein